MQGMPHCQTYSDGWKLNIAKWINGDIDIEPKTRLFQRYLGLANRMPPSFVVNDNFPEDHFGVFSHASLRMNIERAQFLADTFLPPVHDVRTTSPGIS